MVTNHQHVQMLVECIQRERHLVGLVEEGRQFASPQTLIMSGACPARALVWYLDRASLKRADGVLHESASLIVSV